MKLIRKLFFISLVLCFTFKIGISSAQNTNLLTNGGFDGSFTNTSGNQVASGWTAWHIPATEDMPSFQNAAPKYQAVAPDSTRIRTGSNAQVYFSFFETHEGGLYQKVSGVQNGGEYRFSIYAHIWSSTFEDVNVSEDPGEVALRVGIDPNGGTDGASSNIIWSTAAIFYDTYRQYSVIANAKGTSITVFVESTVGSPVQNTYVYLDDAVLESTSSGTGSTQPTATQVPSNGGIGNNTPTPENAIPTNTPIPTATPVPTTVTSSQPISETFPGTITHTVRSGDTVSRIAVLYGSTVEAIISANGLNQSALIFVGQGLIVPVRIPDPATVTPTSTNVVIVVTATQAAAPIPTPNASGSTYVIQPGDTLNKIALQFNTTVGALVQLNGIANPNRIFSGQTIRISATSGNTGSTSGGTNVVPTAPNIIPTPTSLPAQTTYTVVPGDTLYRLALRFNVNIVTLAQANNITNYNRIFIGQVLKIPR